MGQLKTETSAYDFQVQVMACPSCAAPVMAPPGGGQVECEHCGSALTFTRRETAQPPVAAETPEPGQPTGLNARLEWLASELADPERKSRYDTTLRTLPELSAYHGKAFKPAALRANILPKYHDEWQKELERVAQYPDDADTQWRLYWLTDRLAAIHEELSSEAAGAEATEDSALRCRATLETGLKLLDGTPYGYVLKCDLARAAARAGDAASAEQWLQGCDPEIDDPDLDGEYRVAQAAISVARDDHHGIRKWLGDIGGEVPISGTRNRILAATMKVHALELKGNVEAAASLLARYQSRYGPGKVWNELCVQGLAPETRQHARGSIRRVRLGCLAVVLVGLGVGGYFFATRVLGVGQRDVPDFWGGRTCLVDANGDGILDVVSLTRYDGNDDAPVILDGKGGEVIWGGPEYKKATLHCLSPDWFVVAKKSFQLLVHRARKPKVPVKIQASDRPWWLSMGKGCFRLRTADDRVAGYTLPGGATTPCSSAPEFRDPRKAYWRALRRLRGRMTTEMRHRLTGRSATPGRLGLSEYNTTIVVGQREYLLRKKRRGTELLIVKVTEGGKTIWEKRLPYEGSFSAGIAVGQGVVMVWGKDREKDRPVLAGLDAKTGAQKYAKLQPEGMNSFGFYRYNGRFLLVADDSKLLAFEPKSGETAWSIGK